MGVYLRYEGIIAGQDSSHALTAGLRMTWSSAAMKSDADIEP
jgi:hypothetical protein